MKERYSASVEDLATVFCSLGRPGDKSWAKVNTEACGGATIKIIPCPIYIRKCNKLKTSTLDMKPRQQRALHISQDAFQGCKMMSSRPMHVLAGLINCKAKIWASESESESETLKRASNALIELGSTRVEVDSSIIESLEQQGEPMGLQSRIEVRCKRPLIYLV